ncbi:MAG TPA: START domain-containing protein, partial [Polyangiaceae bacterium]|nr:START domain-containing protein [Polyangiaceae bacterium]
RRDVPGSSIVALRGEGFIAAPIARVASVLADRKRSPEWIDRLVKTKVLRELSDTEAINWNHIKTPSPLKDRDFVFKTTISTDPAKKKVTFSYHSVKDSLAPEYDAYVRGDFQSGKFELTMAEVTHKDGSKTRGTLVVAEVVVDPRGSVPTFLVNMVQKSWPHKTLTALRKQVAKPDIKDDPRVVDRLSREGFLQ